jgi:hypothetical protein
MNTCHLAGGFKNGELNEVKQLFSEVWEVSRVLRKRVIATFETNVLLPA